MRRYGLISSGTIWLIAVLIAAWHSNPDEAHFQRWVSRQMKGEADGMIDQLAMGGAAKLLLAAADWNRTDYAFCSVVIFHRDPPAYFVGAFGHWWRIAWRTPIAHNPAG